MKIYIIKNNLNNIVYIGQTSQSLEERLKHHYSNIKSGKTLLNKAMRELGKENFYIQLLENVESQNADERELYWILKYKETNELYNMKLSLGKCGGDTYMNHPEINRIKKTISEKAKGENNSNAHPVRAINLLTNETKDFGSIKECQTYFDIPRHDIIRRRCTGKIKKLYKNYLTFEYL